MIATQPSPQCAVIGCRDKIVARGFCAYHYQVRHREGRFKVPIPQTFSIDDLRAEAAGRGGECLADNYTTHKPIPWKCANGHTWMATWASIHWSKTWCPSCSKGRSEDIVRRVLERMFAVSFPRMRPGWLRQQGNKRGLELDGYNADRRIAFEYQGAQHYESTRQFSATHVDAIRARDAEKRRLCWDHGVSLIVVHTIKKSTDLDSILGQVEIAVLAANLKIPRKWGAIRPTSLTEVWVPPQRTMPDRITATAIARGGVCHSTTYVNNYTALNWECAAGHKWMAPWHGVARGNWCQRCANKKNGRDG